MRKVPFMTTGARGRAYASRDNTAKDGAGPVFSNRRTGGFALISSGPVRCWPTLPVIAMWGRFCEVNLEFWRESELDITRYIVELKKDA